MSKYQPLAEYLAGRSETAVPMVCTPTLVH